jgi:hypothetical protein
MGIYSGIALVMFLLSSRYYVAKEMREHPDSPLKLETDGWIFLVGVLYGAIWPLVVAYNVATRSVGWNAHNRALKAAKRRKAL